MTAERPMLPHLPPCDDCHHRPGAYWIIAPLEAPEYRAAWLCPRCLQARYGPDDLDDTRHIEAGPLDFDGPA